jgi:hypothetical protein
MSLKTIKVAGRRLPRWVVLTWRGNLAFPLTFKTRKEARAAKAWDDQQVVRASIVLATHRVKA